VHSKNGKLLDKNFQVTPSRS